MEDHATPTPDLVAPSLRALLAEIVDYAGLFPPAELPLDEALHNYTQYRDEEEAWMLARFVIPTKRLGDLSAYSGLFRRKAPYAFSVLGTGGATPADFLDAFASDLARIGAFETDHHDRVSADAMEVRLPAPLQAGTTHAVLDFLTAVNQQLVRHGTAKLDIFFEIAPSDETLEALPAVAAAVAEHNSQGDVPLRSEVGLKLRCGGLKPSMVPTVPQVATFIDTCRRAGVRFKATAGLHHPVRHFDDTLETMMHGFFNVFGAAVFADAHALDAAALHDILQEDNPENFRFTKEAFGWREALVPIDAVRAARASFAMSFGSCSFEEPVFDLRDLDLL